MNRNSGQIAAVPASAAIAVTEMEASAMELENVKRHIEGKTVRKVIVVQGKLVNIVVG